MLPFACPPQPAHHAVALPRAHNDRRSPLLALPDTLLSLIAKLMGKRARLLCSKLQQAHGSAGATIDFVDYTSHGRTGGTFFSTPYTDILSSWHHRDAVGRLALDTTLTAEHCALLATALPNLRELSCNGLDGPMLPICNVAEPEHPSLTSLDLTGESTGNPWTIAAFAPNLQALTMRSCTRVHPLGLWLARLRPLRSLRHLHLALHAYELGVPTVAGGMQHLTGLTHLGLHDHEEPFLYGIFPNDKCQTITQALAGLPHLESLKIQGFAILGESLGAGLQALQRLKRLELLRSRGGLSEESIHRMLGAFPTSAPCPAWSTPPSRPEPAQTSSRCAWGGARHCGSCGCTACTRRGCLWCGRCWPTCLR
jgi:hypothetical protein